jgi:hypothetical protein
MRPDGVESIRAVQAALAVVIAPELKTPFAQDATQTLQMLLESMAGEWDTAAQDLRDDNEALVGLLDISRKACESLPNRNERMTSAVSQIERVRDDGGGSIAISALAARNRVLREALEQTLMAFEDEVAETGTGAIASARSRIYQHLRKVASRGWSFWDVASFRGKMTEIRAASAQDDAPPTRAVE